MSKRKVCVVLVDRANYGRLKPVMEALRDEPELEMQVLAGGTLVLERFGHAVKVVERDGFAIAGEVYMELEGNTPATMAKSVGFGIVEFTNEFQRLKPDVVVVIGDRYEALGAAIAAAYMNLTLVHLQGGEVSGSIDESARHAISKFAHFHFPATELAAENLLRMGEEPWSILGVGCPSSDIARQLDQTLDPRSVFSTGSGADFDLEQPFLLSVFHPTTTEFGGETGQVRALLGALAGVAMPTLLLWPNIDAGSDHISKEIRRFKTSTHSNWLRTITNLDPTNYLRVLARTACAIGNSSSFVRDAGFFGTPVVLVGNRQQGRERGSHVVPVEPEEERIESAIRAQLDKGRYAPIGLYGDGFVSQRVVQGIKTLKPYTQKRLSFAESLEEADR